MILKHKKKIIKSILLSLLFVPFSAYAILCPNNFNQISEGDSIEQVKALCGKPNQEETKEVKQKGPEEWSYFVPKSFASSSANSTSAQTTMKIAVVFDETGKAVNISVNGIGVGSTNLCGSSIESGDLQEAVKSACGKPTFINTQENSGGAPQITKRTEWTYNTTPPSKLIFENGKLKEKQ